MVGDKLIRLTFFEAKSLPTLLKRLKLMGHKPASGCISKCCWYCQRCDRELMDDMRIDNKERFLTRCRP